ncbi:YybH family protein [Rhodohalobacter halophilus]|uniref:YybH family protein n=1 Tax=Rhodohalobacter halophilus TaxID=1812810 RepID=UPI00083F96C4|nr:nuclear transport factor 2 family protein [Rhodohalobacter halophilus]
MKSIFITIILTTLSFTVLAQTDRDKSEILKTLHDFETAIIDSDSMKAENLLDTQARIVEGSQIENKEEYLSHHFYSDGRFLSAMDREVISQDVFVNGNTAWVTSKSHLSGVYNDRDLSLNSMELIVLKKTENTWRIAAVHWSSDPN